MKNGLLAGIELIDALRSSLDDVDKSKGGGEAVAVSTDSGNEESGPSEQELLEAVSGCVKRITELDSTLHEVLDTVLAEAMARDTSFTRYITPVWRELMCKLC